MTIESWKAEYYPIEACEVAESVDQAIINSLNKWVGLRKENLKKHKCELNYGQIRYYDSIQYMYTVFEFSTSTCALCILYYRDVVIVKSASEKCKLCPIKIAGKCCLHENSPYDIMLETNNPEPMIKVLTDCILEDNKALKNDG